MRKTASILLLVILLFNMIGYRAWFFYAEKKADAKMESRIDHDQYNKDELISIIIPLDNPYQTEDKNTERISGEINFQGKTYKYVKRTITDGKLILFCISDAHKTILRKAKAELGNSSESTANNSKSSSRSGFQKSFNGNDFIAHNMNTQMYCCVNAEPSQNGNHIRTLSDAHTTSPGKPPRQIS